MAPDRVQLVEEYKQSKLTQKEFAEQRGVTSYALQYWLLKLRKEGRSEKGARFLPIHVVASAPSARPGSPEVVEAALVNGLRLRFTVGTDIKYITQLLTALAG